MGLNFENLPVFADDNLGPIDWKTRFKIAIGTARGLHYLHKDCQRRIIHRDIKSSNILLTADFEPLVCHFHPLFLVLVMNFCANVFVLFFLCVFGFIDFRFWVG